MKELFHFVLHYRKCVFFVSQALFFQMYCNNVLFIPSSRFDDIFSLPVQRSGAKSPKNISALVLFIVVLGPFQHLLKPFFKASEWCINHKNSNKVTNFIHKMALVKFQIHSASKKSHKLYKKGNKDNDFNLSKVLLLSDVVKFWFVLRLPIALIYLTIFLLVPLVHT